MSKFGLKVADKIIFGVKDANQAIDLIEKVVKQFLGGSWTQYEPKCPICDEKLKDFQKHMNRPIGECVHESCQSTIFPSDYIGKIMDIIKEVHILREEEEVAKKNKAKEVSSYALIPSTGKEKTPVVTELGPEPSQTDDANTESNNAPGDIVSKKMYAGLPVIDW